MFPQILLILLILSLGACERRSEVRQYTELVTEVKAPPMMESALPVAPSPSSTRESGIQWTVPEGWMEQPAGGMRLAAFTSEGEAPIECTIVSLSGSAGGLKANVVRWLGQINLSLTEEELGKLLSTMPEINSGISTGKLVDLTQFSSADPSILAAVYEQADNTYFIKMTGSRAAIAANRDRFMTFNQSLAVR